jgi:predicted acetyltransferase
MVEALDIAAPSDEAELAAFGAIASRSFGFPRDRWQVRCQRLGASNLRVIREGADIVGGLAILPMGHWFGGRAVPCWGISLVAIAPEHRSRGMAAELMRTALEEAHREGVALSSLYPATFPVYRAAGYETAGNRIVYRLALPPLRIGAGPGEGGGGSGEDCTLRAATRADDPATLRSLYEERARHAAGAVDRTAYFWQRVLDPPSGEEVQAYLVEGERRPEGYVVLSQGPATPHQPMEVTVRDAVARTAPAGRRILRLLADHRSLVRSASLASGPGDPLLLVAREEPHEIADVLRWMVRVVDVRAALERRGWSPLVRGELHLDVRDGLLRENARRWVVEVADGKAEVREGGSGALAIDVRGLAALYTGFLPAEELRAAELCEGDNRELARASALFAGPAPWVADFY